MPKYLIKASYTAEGIKGVLKEGGSSRRSVVEQLAKGLGGRMEAFYFAFGDDDVYTILEFPDNVSAAAVSMTVCSAGAVSSTVTVLLSPEEIDAATKKSVSYRAPGAAKRASSTRRRG
jgi:uncharacterized protein with GYD domain